MERIECLEGGRNLAAYLAGELSEMGRARFLEHLGECAACRADVEIWGQLEALPAARPSARLRQNFDAMMAREVGAAEGQDRRRPELWKAQGWKTLVTWAAAAALMVGTFAGGAYWGGWRVEQRSRDEVAELRGELRGMRTMVAVSLLQQESAVERLRGVGFAVGMDNPESGVVRALVQTLRNDSSVDVRLAAVDALRRYAGRAEVRQAIVESVAMQESPLLQVVLVDTLAEFRERGAKVELERLRGLPEVDPSVRARAEAALRVLSQRELLTQ
jgi:hypothetical protein